MAKNTLTDLNNHLMAQIEELREDNLKGDDLKESLKKAKGISELGKVIVENAKTMVAAAKLSAEYNGTVKDPLKLLSGNE